MRSHPALLVMILAVAVPVWASQPLSLHEVFPFEAPITTSGPGLHRLELPRRVLTECRSDLSDLRIFDDRGRQVPYLVDTRPANLEIEVLHRVEAKVVAVQRHREGARPNPIRYLETYTIELPPLPDDAGAWELVIESRRSQLVARIDMVAVTADGGRLPLLTGGSLFRLGRPQVERLRFPLSISDAPQLELAIVNEDAGYLEPSFRLEALRSIRHIEPSAVVLEQLQVRQLPTRTEVVVERPRGIVPGRLRLRTATGAFHRHVMVWDEGSGAEATPLGERELLRIDAIVPVEVTDLALRPARGDRLRMVIENRDSPPLEGIEVAAEVPQPVLFFSLPEGVRQAILRFGGARAHRPDYDLAALAPALGTISGAGEVDLVLALWDPGRSRAAELGAVCSNSEYDPAPALAFAMHPGAELGPRTFSHRRQLQVEPSQEGLSHLRLQPEDLARLRPDLADLRIVDGESRQWAYLLERGSAGTMIALVVSKHRASDGRSRYTIEPPVKPLLLDRLVVEPAAPFFDRAFQLLGTPVEGRQTTLATGRLVRHHGDPRPVTITVQKQRLQELQLVIEDGDDAPLVLEHIEARVPQPDLYLAAPAGSYTLLLGDPGTITPRYELERVRSTVLGVPAHPVSSGELEPNPELSAASRLASGRGKQQVLLWAVLGLAVLALAGLTLRVARQEKVE